MSDETIKRSPGRISVLVRHVLLFVGIMGTVLSMAGDFTQGSDILRTWLFEHVNVMSALLHLVLIMLILFPGRIRLLNQEVDDPEVRAVVRCINRFFLRAWTFIWVFFGLLYTVMMFKTLEPEKANHIIWDAGYYHHRTIETILMDLFNLGSTLCIFLAFGFLLPSFLRRYTRNLSDAEAHSAVSSERRSKLYELIRRVRMIRNEGRPSDPDRDRRIAIRRANQWGRYPEFCWPFGFILCCAFTVIIVRLHTLEYLHLAQQIEVLTESFIGFLSALALGHFAGRMDSRFIMNWQWIIVVLFLYAAIQTYTTVLYGESDMGRAIFTYSAFTMKCMLFIFVSDFFENRRVVYYAHELIHANKEREL